MIPLTLIIESVNPIDTRTLVVPPQDEKVFRVLDLVRQQQAYCLETLLSPVHVIAQEQVIGLGRESTILEQPQQVIVLSMDIPTDLYRRFEFQENRLGDEDFASLGTEVLYLVLLQLDRFAWSVAADCSDRISTCQGIMELTDPLGAGR